MAIVPLSSSSGSGGGDEGGSSDVSKSSSPNSRSSSRVEGSDRTGGSLVSSDPSADRIGHGEALFWLEGGIEVDAMKAEPVGGWPAIGGYEWASHDIGSYESEYKSQDDLLVWVNQSFLARHEEDARLFHLSVSYPNERDFHGNGTSVEDFFFVYTYLFHQIFFRVPFMRFQGSYSGG